MYCKVVVKRGEEAIRIKEFDTPRSKQSVKEKWEKHYPKPEYLVEVDQYETVS